MHGVAEHGSKSPHWRLCLETAQYPSQAVTPNKGPTGSCLFSLKDAGVPWDAEFAEVVQLPKRTVFYKQCLHQRCGYTRFGEVPVDRPAAGAAESPSGKSHTSVLPPHPLP